MAVKVGSFIKSTNTSVPVTQAITGVGFQPRALIMWTVGATEAGTWIDTFSHAVGFSARNAAGTITQGSCGSAIQDNVGTSVIAGSRETKALAVEQYDETLLAACDLTSFDAGGFTLSWTTNNNAAWIIHYMALGGPDLTDAYVKAWTMPASTGNQSTSGVGFQPDCVLHTASASSTAFFMFGAMTASAQWNNSFHSSDGKDTMDTQRGQSTDAALRNCTLTLLTVLRAVYSSMDADGFTVNWTTAPGVAYQVYSLCLKGGSYKLGAFNCRTSAGSQAVTDVGFRPDGVLFSSWHLVASVSFTGNTRWSLGAMDGSASHAAVLNDENNVGTSNCAALSKTDECIVIADNNTKTVNGEADVEGLGSDGFSVDWSSAASPASQILYFAFDGGSATGSALLMQHHHHAGMRGSL